MFSKGTTLHELLRLPQHVVGMYRLRRNDMYIEKIKYGRSWRQRMLFMKPKNPSLAIKGVVIYIHGGAWISGGPEMFKSTAQFFVDQGFVVFNWTYRMLPLYHYKHMREDITQALLTTLNILKERNLSHKKILLGGTSAGGHLAAHLLYNRKILAKYGLSQELFAGLFAYVSPLDLNEMKQGNILRMYAGQKGSDQFLAANPINYIQDNEHLPVLCVHGANDGMVSFKSNFSFVEKMRRFNPTVIEFHLIENGTHLSVSNSFFDGSEKEKAIFSNWMKKLTF